MPDDLAPNAPLATRAACPGRAALEAAHAPPRLCCRLPPPRPWPHRVCSYAKEFFLRMEHEGSSMLQGRYVPLLQFKGAVRRGRDSWHVHGTPASRLQDARVC